MQRVVQFPGWTVPPLLFVFWDSAAIIIYPSFTLILINLSIVL
jgi:hypothetical protein